MPSQHQAYIEMEEAITDYMNEAELSNHKYFKLWHIAFRGLTELGLDFFYTVQSVKLPINANLTVTLPNNYLNYSKVGVFNNVGEVIPLGYNNNLSTFSDLQPQRLQQTQDNSLVFPYYQQTPIWYNYWNNGAYSNIYGLPSGAPFAGSFKIDNANGVILLSETFGYDYVLLEYIASPIEGESCRIPIQFKEALIAYLRWKDVISIPAKTHVMNSNIGMRRHDFYQEREHAIARWRPFYLEEVYNINLQNQRLTVKV